jgi:crooked neck
MADAAAMERPARQRQRVDKSNPAAGAVKKGLTRVMNKSAAAAQVTAEQLLAESFDLNRREADVGQPRLIITSREELAMHQRAKRQEFEGQVRKDVHSLGPYLRYAAWEAHQPGCAPQARSVYERATDFHAGHRELWKAYAEFEMSQGNVQRTRDVLERGVSTNPAAEDLWLLRILVERTVGTVEATRDTFNRWMRFGPAEAAWRVFAKFELDQRSAHDRGDRVRAVLSQFAAKHNNEATWVFYAKCERILGNPQQAVAVLETALMAMPNAYAACPSLVLALAEALEDVDDIDKAREVYQTALRASEIAGKASTDEHAALRGAHQTFELIHGSEDQVVQVIFDSRRVHYRNVLAEQPMDMMSWFSLINIEIADGLPTAEVLALYDRASFSAVPTGTIAETKDTWQPHAFMWIANALFREQECGDASGAEDVLKRGLACIHDRPFTFSKLWIALAELHIRHNDLEGARVILSRAAEHRPTQKVIHRAIEIETLVGNDAAVEAWHKTYIARFGHLAAPWLSLARYRDARGDAEGSAAALRAAFENPALVERDPVWSAGIAEALRRHGPDAARPWYTELLSMTQKACVEVAGSPDTSADEIDAVIVRLKKIMAMLSRFEFTFARETAVARIRACWEELVKAVRGVSVNVAAPLVADWQDFEARHGTVASQQAIQNMLQAKSVVRRGLFAKAKQFKE